MTYVRLCRRVRDTLTAGLGRRRLARYAGRHGLVLVDDAELDRLCADAVEVLVAEIEQALRPGPCGQSEGWT